MKTSLVRMATGLVLIVGTAPFASADEPRLRGSPTVRLEKDDKVRELAGSTSVSSGDITLLTAFARSALLEVEASKIGATASHKDTRDLAQVILRDHAKSSAELRVIASAEGVDLPVVLEEDVKREVEALARKQDSELDRAYVTMMIRVHVAAVEQLDEAARDALDPDLQAWAARHLPTARAHLRFARVAEARLDQLSLF